MLTVCLILVSYVIGSIPTSIIFGKVFRGIDIREHGSHNPGATNTFRVLGKGIGVTVGAIDIFKGYFCVVFLTMLIPADVSVSSEIRRILAGLAAVSGHVWTMFAGFKGGKGVGTAFGVFLGLAPLSSLFALIVWVVLTFGTGYVSLGSIAAAAVLPASIIILGLINDNLSYVLSTLALLVGALVIVRHRSNIGRLFRGEENRFGKRGKQ
ncbi:MAG: glycerol-3-phosphate 1-O-acyltransferase PlsY [Candidatus Latescibacteria bacterium]|nr:glycerol-3-phosphate 1-O-acyltransferase PlsY [Candidatus Latescibacterota bacterium]